MLEKVNKICLMHFTSSLTAFLGPNLMTINHHTNNQTRSVYLPYTFKREYISIWKDNEKRRNKRLIVKALNMSRTGSFRDLTAFWKHMVIAQQAFNSFSLLVAFLLLFVQRLTKLAKTKKWFLKSVFETFTRSLQLIWGYENNT